MAISRYESRRRQLKELEKITHMNPEVLERPILPIKPDKLVNRLTKEGHPPRVTKHIKKKKR